MCCCCRKKKTLDVTYTGRHCTDILCLVLFAAVWFVTIIIMIAASRTSDSAALSFGRDYNGDVCGSEISHPGAKTLGCDVEGCQQIYYPKLSEDVSVSLLSNASISLFGICLPSCPSASDIVCTYNYTDTMGTPLYDEVIQCTNLFYRATHSDICNNCWVVPLNTTNVMNRCIPVVDTQTQTNKRCIVPESPADPSDPDYIDPDSASCLAQSVEEVTTQTKAAQTDVLTNALLNVQVFLQRYMSDIRSSVIVLLIGGVTSFVLGFVFLFFVKSCSQFMVWLSIIAGLLLCVFVTLFLYYQANILPLDDWFNFVVQKGDETFHWGNITFDSIVEEIPEFMMASDSTRDYWAIAAYVMTALTVILFFVVIALSNAVKTSAEVMKQASNAIRKIPSILLVPIVITLLNVIVTVLVAYSYSLTLSSDLTLTDYTDQLIGTVGVHLPKNSTYMFCEDPETMTNCTYLSKAMGGNSGTDLFLAFWHLFVWFWSSGFINAIGTMTVAGTVGKWYFKKSDDKKSVGVSTVLQTLLCVFCYHLGSVAYGSFIIAVIQLFRSIMLYLDTKFKENQSKNPLVKCGFKCCHCCLACLEKCMKYLSRNAYILVITRGHNFFKASVTSFSLLAANIGTVSVLKSVSTLFIWMGKLSNVILSVLVVVVMIYNCPDFLSHPIITPVGPAVVALILSYIISSIFIHIFVITIDTIMLCYCEDIREHGKNAQELEGKIGSEKKEETTEPEVPTEGEAVVEDEAVVEEAN